MIKIFFVLFILIPLSSYTQKIRVGLYFEHVVKKIDFNPKEGSFLLFIDSVFIGNYQLNAVISIEAKLNELQLITQDSLYSGKKVMFIPNKYKDFFQINPTLPDLKARNYEGELHVELTIKNNLKIINVIELSDYLEGVVESEAGTGQLYEYYKVQSIISRTFALKNWKKHEADGFNLCDQVHCQAYLHKRNASINLIDSAVLETSMDVLLSQDSSLVPTFFHANCGGQIADPEWVWNSSINGLCSFEDPFCRHTKQATWIKSIPLEKWTNHFSSTYDFPVHDSICFGLLTNFNQEQRRSFFIHPMFGIPLRDIRESFRLKSTFFSVALLEKNVILTGKGFGHGVGLCQEGAMNMAKKGYKANEILDFYFPNAELHTNWLIHE